MKIGLFFGSFNPIHIGHLIIADIFVENSDLDQVWFIVSPQNPFKKKSSLLHEFDRINMVRLAIADNPKFRDSDIEFSMPKPSFTIDTLTYLSEKHPQHQFNLIIGQDNLNTFPKWKNYKQILKNYGLLVYPRSHSKPSNLLDLDNVKMIEAPQVEISATFIRNSVKKIKSIRYLVHQDVASYISMQGFYV